MKKNCSKYDSTADRTLIAGIIFMHRYHSFLFLFLIRLGNDQIDCTLELWQFEVKVNFNYFRFMPLLTSIEILL